MTKDKAKTLLDNLIGMVEDNQASDYDEALRMAILELEQQPCDTSIEQALLLEVIDKFLPTECEDTISRDGVIAEMEELNAVSFYEANEHSKETYYEIKNMIKTISPVTPSRRKGHWIEHEKVYECSECQIIRAKGMTGKYNYCPSCGADMRLINKGELYEGEFEEGDADAT